MRGWWLNAELYALAVVALGPLQKGWVQSLIATLIKKDGFILRISKNDPPKWMISS